MSLALLFLILAVVCAALAAIFYGVMSNDPTPSMSGSFIPVLIFGAAAPCLLVLSFLTWIVSVTMAVL